MADSVVLKLTLGEDTRRMTVSKSTDFSSLLKTIRSLFPNFPGLTLKYVDDEGDLVTLTSDVELREAIAVASNKQNGVLRVVLFSSAPPQTTSTATTTAKTAAEPQTQQQPSQFAQFTDPKVITETLSSLFQQVTANPQLCAVLPQLLQMFQANNRSGQQQDANNNASTGQLNINPQQLLQLLQNPLLLSFLSQIMQTVSQVSQLSAKDLGASTSNNNTSNPDLTALLTTLGLPNAQQQVTAALNAYGIQPSQIQQSIQGVVANTLSTLAQAAAPTQKAPSTENDQQPKKRNTPPPTRGSNVSNSSLNNSSLNNSNTSNQAAKLLARFVTDVTIPDGTQVYPGQRFPKVWRMRNEGNVPWPEQTVLTFVGGDSLVEQSQQRVYEVPRAMPEEEVDLMLNMVAPLRPGRYVSYWRLACPDGTRFGQRVWCDIIVTPDNTVATPSAATTTVSETPVVATPVSSITPMEEDHPIVVPPVSVVNNNSPVVPEIAIPAVPATPVEEESPELKQLLSMGFSDREQLKVLLAKNGYDVLKTVQDLLSWN